MKQDNRDCKIVQDLLPNYIENLTDEVTNEYIEEHIAKCPECAKALKAMTKDVNIEIEEIDQHREINYLKGIRKRVKRTIAIVSLVLIIIAGCIIGYVYNQSKIQVNNYTFLRASYVRENEQGTIDGNLIAVIDEKGKCKSVRAVEEGYTDDEIARIYMTINELAKDDVANIRIVDKAIHYNINGLNKKSKEQIIEYLVENYNIINMTEI